MLTTTTATPTTPTANIALPTTTMRMNHFDPSNSRQNKSSVVDSPSASPSDDDNNNNNTRAVVHTAIDPPASGAGDGGVASSSFFDSSASSSIGGCNVVDRPLTYDNVRTGKAVDAPPQENRSIQSGSPSDDSASAADSNHSLSFLPQDLDEAVLVQLPLEGDSDESDNDDNDNNDNDVSLLSSLEMGGIEIAPAADTNQENAFFHDDDDGNEILPAIADSVLLAPRHNFVTMESSLTYQDADSQVVQQNNYQEDGEEDDEEEEEELEERLFLVDEIVQRVVHQSNRTSVASMASAPETTTFCRNQHDRNHSFHDQVRIQAEALLQKVNVTTTTTTIRGGTPAGSNQDSERRGVEAEAHSEADKRLGEPEHEGEASACVVSLSGAPVGSTVTTDATATTAHSEHRTWRFGSRAVLVSLSLLLLVTLGAVYSRWVQFHGAQSSSSVGLLDSIPNSEHDSPISPSDILSGGDGDDDDDDKDDNGHDSNAKSDKYYSSDLNDKRINSNCTKEEQQVQVEQVVANEQQEEEHAEKAGFAWIPFWQIVLKEDTHQNDDIMVKPDAEDAGFAWIPFWEMELKENSYQEDADSIAKQDAEEAGFAWIPFCEIELKENTYQEDDDSIVKPDAEVAGFAWIPFWEMELKKNTRRDDMIAKPDHVVTFNQSNALVHVLEDPALVLPEVRVVVAWQNRSRTATTKDELALAPRTSISSEEQAFHEGAFWFDCLILGFQHFASPTLLAGALAFAIICGFLGQRISLNSVSHNSMDFKEHYKPSPRPSLNPIIATPGMGESMQQVNTTSISGCRCVTSLTIFENLMEFHRSFRPCGAGRMTEELKNQALLASSMYGSRGIYGGGYPESYYKLTMPELKLLISGLDPTLSGPAYLSTTSKATRVALLREKYANVLETFTKPQLAQLMDLKHQKSCGEIAPMKKNARKSEMIAAALEAGFS